MAQSTGERLARLEALFEGASRSLEILTQQGRDAAESRKKVYERQEKTARDIMMMNHRLDQVEKGIEALKPTSAEYERVRDRVVFAGRLGRVLWSIGKGLLAAAAGAASAWYAMTGRPPP